MLNQIETLINQVPAFVWPIALQVVVTAIVVSPVGIALHKWWQVESDKIKVFNMIVLSMAGAGIAYMMTVPEFKPWFVTVQGFLTFALSTPFYIFFFKPGAAILGDWFGGKIDEATAINEAKSAAVGVNTVVPGTVDPSDFSH